MIRCVHANVPVPAVKPTYALAPSSASLTGRLPLYVATPSWTTATLSRALVAQYTRVTPKVALVAAVFGLSETAGALDMFEFHSPPLMAPR